MMGSRTSTLHLHRCAFFKSGRHMAVCCFILIAILVSYGKLSAISIETLQAIIFFVTVFICGGFRFKECR